LTKDFRRRKGPTTLEKGQEGERQAVSTRLREAPRRAELRPKKIVNLRDKRGGGENMGGEEIKNNLGCDRLEYWKGGKANKKSRRKEQPERRLMRRLQKFSKRKKRIRSPQLKKKHNRGKNGQRTWREESGQQRGREAQRSEGRNDKRFHRHIQYRVSKVARL